MAELRRQTGKEGTFWNTDIEQKKEDLRMDYASPRGNAEDTLNIKNIKNVLVKGTTVS